MVTNAADLQKLVSDVVGWPYVHIDIAVSGGMFVTRVCCCTDRTMTCWLYSGLGEHSLFSVALARAVRELKGKVNHGNGNNGAAGI
jgi:ribosomal protein S12 methylthiotransferase accessory factor YcaO